MPSLVYPDYENEPIEDDVHDGDIVSNSVQVIVDDNDNADESVDPPMLQRERLADRKVAY
jgi:hypothetical protein